MEYYMKSLRKNKIAYIYAAAITVLFLSVMLGVFLGSTKLNLWNALSEMISGNTDSP